MSRYIEADWLLCKIYDLVNAINDEAPTIEPKRGEWVACSERLPSVKEPMLITQDGKAYFAPFGIDKENVPKGVTAWMPLPKPYERSE